MGIWNQVWSSVVFHFWFFGFLLLSWLVVLPVFVRIKYSVLFRKLKNLDDRLKWEREKMDIYEVTNAKIEWSNLRHHLGIGMDEDLLLVNPPTILGLIMESWLEGKETILKILPVFFLIDTLGFILV